MSVSVYTTTTCPYCTMVKEYLKSHNVDFQEINVGEDQEKAQEMIQKSGQTGVPVLDINGKIIIGFNRDAIKEALDIKE
ncbi:glutaredoxin family protein [Candidatus Micrarchaeota archaeon]|nr:glutaredoxin family protein [Candidatus Micrarchaeota archaeon]MBU1929982.1 glutaredoxin family protein [Candidatus Micrarchaeota archaeon]